MKKALHISFLILLLGSVSASASVREKTLGVGFAFGDMTGISFKTWRGEETGIGAVFSWRRKELRFSISFLNHFFNTIEVENNNIPVYYGLGTRVKIREDDSDENTLGLRFPVGVSYIFLGPPLDAFAEIAPVLDIVPETDLHLRVMAGMRYYF